MNDVTYVYKILVGKPEGKRPLRRPRHGWEDNIKIYLGETDVRVWTGFMWLRIGLVGALVNKVMNLPVP
jgi:hypothetical protein